nr:unnamed protein product [Callosobruchus analis]
MLYRPRVHTLFFSKRLC